MNLGDRFDPRLMTCYRAGCDHPRCGVYYDFPNLSAAEKWGADHENANPGHEVGIEGYLDIIVPYPRTCECGKH